MSTLAPVLLGDFDTPETLMAVRPEAPPGVHLDALNTALGRAEAILQLVDLASASQAAATLPRGIVAPALDAVVGLIREAHVIANHREGRAQTQPIEPAIGERLRALAETWNGGRLDTGLMERLGLAMARTEGADQ